MILKEIFPKLQFDEKTAQIKISGLSDDSRLLSKEDLFFVIERKNFDIFSVLEEVQSKASAFVIDKKNKQNIKNLKINKPLVFVSDINREFQRLVNLFYGLDKKSMKAIAVTGTNGKTTTSFLIYSLLRKLGQKCALIGTVKYYIGKRAYRPTHTTPDFLSLRKLLKKAQSLNSKFAIVEVSSHAIAQERIKGLRFSHVVFTNLSRDHLDYHKTIKEYSKVKESLFLTNKKAKSIINIDDACGKNIYRKINSKISYAINSEADFKAENIKLTKKGSFFDLIFKGKRFKAKIKLCGKHNISNALAAIALVYSLGFSLDEVLKFISSLKEVQGRLQEVTDNVFIDYAHTPDALNKVLTSLRNMGYKGVIALFGCGGQRDKGKRQIMGRVSSKLADYTFITSDNPRGEDVLSICEQIKKGVINENYEIIPDREKAIKKALDFLAKKNKKEPNYCLLIAGKGHEDYQILGKKRIHFKDKEVVKKVLNK